MHFRYLFAIFSILAFGIIAGAQEPQIDPSRAGGALLGPGDEITGRVVGESEYDFVAFINDDGYLEVPFSKEPVLAKCKTERQLRLDLIDRLSTYIKSPQFSFRVTNRNSRPPTTISGEVYAPQRVVLMRKVTLFEMLTIGGGAKEDSAGGQVQVFRPQNPICPDSDEESRWTVDPSDPTQIPSRTYSLTNIQMGEKDSNPYIYPGDVVVVQRAAPVYITGEVNNSIGLFMKEGGLSLTEAIAKVGGFRREAKIKDIRISRRNESAGDKREWMSVNYDLIRKGEQEDVMLKPNDIVVVGVAKDGVAKQILDLAMGAAKTTIMAAGNAGAYRVIY
jgi:polysaccharide export outer membrane protein